MDSVFLYFTEADGEDGHEDGQGGGAPACARSKPHQEEAEGDFHWRLLDAGLQILPNQP